MYFQRSIKTAFDFYLRHFCVIGITGPRQAGKSTFLLHELKDNYRYVTFDDFQTMAFFEDDPERFMQTYNDKVIFDEVQKAPKLFSYIKRLVDNDKNQKGRFILTGSCQFNLMKNMAESLAGRIGLLNLLPLDESEMPQALQKDALLNGCYPELVVGNYEYTTQWYNAYLSTYLEKDIRILNNIQNLTDFRRFLSLLAARVGQVINHTALASDLGVQQPTIKHWLSVLEASYIIFLLPPYHNNFGKRIIKSPKLYFYDSGLVAFLLNLNDFNPLHSNPVIGVLFESYIISDCKKQLFHRDSSNKIYYFRSSNQEEVDLIIDHGEKKSFIEIKYSATFKPSMVKTLLKFSDDNHQLYLIYNGQNFPYHGVTIDSYQPISSHLF